MEENFLSISEAAKLLDVCQNTLREWDESGKFKASRSDGGHRRYSLSQIREYLDRPKEDHQFNVVCVPTTDPIEEKWRDRGYLDGNKDSRILAHILECVDLNYESHFGMQDLRSRNLPKNIFTKDQTLWLTKESWSQIKLKKAVNIQPMSSPCALAFYKEENEFSVAHIRSEAVAARDRLMNFSIFPDVDFERVKDIYAAAIAREVDEIIMEKLPKTEFDVIQDLITVHGIEALESLYDYIIIPDIVDLKSKKMDIFRHDVFIEELTPVIIAGRYPQFMQKPIFMPYVHLSSLIKKPNGTYNFITRFGWTD